jgi:hypothetical protein
MKEITSSYTERKKAQFIDSYQDWQSRVERRILSCFMGMENSHLEEEVSGVSPVNG